MRRAKLRGDGLKFGKNEWRKSLLLGCIVFLICALSGFIAGQIFKSNDNSADAFSGNISIVDNDQVMTVDQSTNVTTITRTSTVTVTDTSHTGSYTLSAKLAQNTIASSTITIGSSSSTLCPASSPCPLSSTSSNILETFLTSALTTGDTTEWTVKITLPPNTNPGNYLVDVEYGEETILPLTNGMNMQDSTAQHCKATLPGTIVNLIDVRNSNTYKVRRMEDNKCWMISNLAYAGNQDGTDDNTYGDVHNLTFVTACMDATAPCTGASAWTSSTGTTTRFVTTNNFTGSDQPDRDGNTIQNTAATLNNGTQCTTNETGSGVMRSKCLSYLYNWCSAIGLDSTTTPTCAGVRNTTGTGYASTGVIGKPGGYGGESKGNSSAGNQAGVNSTTAGSICPAGWRLPVGRVGITNNTTSNSKNEFAILNGSMHNGTYTATPDVSSGTGYVENWQPGGLFASVAGGVFNPGFGLRFQSVNDYVWSSSVGVSNSSSYLNVFPTSVNPGTNDTYRYFGVPVRCVM